MKELLSNYHKLGLALTIIFFVVICCQRESSNDFTIKVYTYEKFTGNYLVMQPDGQSISKSVEGRGNAQYKVKGSMVSCSFQKSEEGSSSLRVEIYKNDKSIKSEVTEASYGVVTIASQ